MTGDVEERGDGVLVESVVGVGADGFNVFLYDLLCFFLWIFHIYPPYRFRMRPAFPGPFPLLSKPKFGADAGDQPAVFQRL